MTPIRVEIEMVKENENENVYFLHINDEEHGLVPDTCRPPVVFMLSDDEAEVNIFTVDSDIINSLEEKTTNTYAVKMPVGIPPLGLEINIRVINEQNKVFGTGKGKVRNPSVKIITRPIESQDKVS